MEDRENLNNTRECFDLVDLREDASHEVSCEYTSLSEQLQTKQQESTQKTTSSLTPDKPQEKESDKKPPPNENTEKDRDSGHSGDLICMVRQFYIDSPPPPPTYTDYKLVNC